MSDHTTLQQLAEVKGQLSAVMTMLGNQHESTQLLISQQHQATNQRIEDLRTAMHNQHTAVEKRIDSVSGRVTVLENNERATAIKAAGVSALMGGGVAAFLTALKIKFGG